MTREDIIRMAREARFEQIAGDDWVCFTDEIERFAALVAARTLEGSYDEMIALVAAAEREAWAKVCDEMEASGALSSLEKYRTRFIADAIRARSQS